MKSSSRQISFLLLVGVILIMLLGGSFWTYPAHAPEPNFSIKSTNASMPTADFSDVMDCIPDPHITFFMYHYIRDDDLHDNSGTRDLSVPPGIFREHMETVRKIANSGNISLMQGDEFLQSLKNHCFPSKNIWIFTSDDGWEDSSVYLAPIAKSYNIPFFFGIIGNRIGQTGFMSSGQILDIARDPLFTISSHSMTHNNETKMTGEKEHYEICESKKVLEKLINKSVDTYIYPSGRMNSGSSIPNLKDCGYTLAWTTGFGQALDLDHPDIYQINRTRVSHDTNRKFFIELAARQYAQISQSGSQQASAHSGRTLNQNMIVSDERQMPHENEIHW